MGRFSIPPFVHLFVCIYICLFFLRPGCKALRSRWEALKPAQEALRLGRPLGLAEWPTGLTGWPSGLVVWFEWEAHLARRLRTNVKTNKQTENLPILQDFVYKLWLPNSLRSQSTRERGTFDQHVINL